MFGIKNPQKVLGMMKMFGIKPEILIEQTETMLIEQWKKLEATAGARLTAVAALDNTGTHFVSSLYRVEQDGSLSLWKCIPTHDLKNLLKK